MNINEIVQNINDKQIRMRPYNDNFGPNYCNFNIGMPPLMYNYSPQVMINTNGGYAMVNSNIESSSDQSGVFSPNLDTNTDRLLYRISTWQDIADKYEGNEQRPKCGKLNSNVYFTQRATSSDVYMLFDRKSDYINNFVNYYFSDKNLARDQKLVALMDDKGVIPLSALIKFPKLHQIDSTIEDLIKAFQNNTFVMAVDVNGERGAQRRDKWCPVNSHKSASDKLNDGVIDNTVITEQSPTIVHNDISSAQSQQFIYFNQPSIYTQPQAMISNAANIGQLAPYPTYPFLSLNPSFPNNLSNQVPPNSQPGNPALYWHIQSPDYANQSLLQQLPIQSRFNANSLETPGGRLN